MERCPCPGERRVSLGSMWRVCIALNRVGTLRRVGSRRLFCILLARVWVLAGPQEWVLGEVRFGAPFWARERARVWFRLWVRAWFQGRLWVLGVVRRAWHRVGWFLWCMSRWLGRAGRLWRCRRGVLDVGSRRRCDIRGWGSKPVLLPNTGPVCQIKRDWICSCLRFAFCLFFFRFSRVHRTILRAGWERLFCTPCAVVLVRYNGS